jgi:hypothetical protein
MTKKFSSSIPTNLLATRALATCEDGWTHGRNGEACGFEGPAKENKPKENKPIDAQFAAKEITL